MAYYGVDPFVRHLILRAPRRPIIWAMVFLQGVPVFLVRFSGSNLDLTKCLGVNQSFEYNFHT